MQADRVRTRRVDAAKDVAVSPPLIEYAQTEDTAGMSAEIVRAGALEIRAPKRLNRHRRPIDLHRAELGRLNCAHRKTLGAIAVIAARKPTS